MIINAIISVITFILDALLQTLYKGVDDVVVDSYVLTAITNAGNWLHNINTLIPLSHIFLVFFSVLVIEAGLLLYKAIRWSYRKIPGIS